MMMMMILDSILFVMSFCVAVDLAEGLQGFVKETQGILYQSRLRLLLSPANRKDYSTSQ